jgi:SAM-dependent methyltransferase
LAGREFSVAAQEGGSVRAVRDAGRRHLPPRYGVDVWDLRFRARLRRLLRPHVRILDLGAGRRPTVRPEDRPPGTNYVGLDLDGGEFAKADPGSYDETVVSAAEERVPSLEGSFDLCLSFFALEHVRSTAEVLENAHAYLAPGGWFLGQLSGARSPFSLANRILPASVSRAILRRTHGRPAESVFAASYDRCTHAGLTGVLAEQGWSEAEVLPLYTGAGYVLFSRALTAAYIGYEEWLYRRDRRDLAPYYMVAARR